MALHIPAAFLTKYEHTHTPEASICKHKWYNGISITNESTGRLLYDNYNLWYEPNDDDDITLGNICSLKIL